MKNRILKIIPYYGKLPVFWDIYMKSVEFNKDVLDVLIVTDIEISEALPANVKVEKMSFSQLQALISAKTGAAIDYHSAYKLCDLKPFLGKVFESQTRGYEFWAYGDIDLVFGDLKRYLKKEILDAHDIISFREDWLSGAFSIFRNREDVNTLYLRSPDWKVIIEKAGNTCFDECCAKYQKLRDGLNPLQCMELNLKGDFYCWTTVIYAAEKQGLLKVYLREYVKESLPFDEIIEYRNGKIIAGGGIERAVYHFVYHKGFARHIIPDWKGIVPDHYYITTTGLYTKEQMSRYTIIKSWRSFLGFISDSRKHIQAVYNYRVKGISK